MFAAWLPAPPVTLANELGKPVVSLQMLLSDTVPVPAMFEHPPLTLVYEVEARLPYPPETDEYEPDADPPRPPVTVAN